MRITSITVENYYGEPTGVIRLHDDEEDFNFRFKGDEANEILAIAWDIFQKRQAAIGERIAAAQPPLLASPNVIDHETF